MNVRKRHKERSMMKWFTPIFIFTLLLSAPVFADNSTIYADQKDQNIEISLFYPVVRYRDASIQDRQKIFVGVGFNYQWYLLPYLGVLFYPWFWYKPVRVNGDNRNLAFAALNTGLALRPLRQSYFDPRLALQTGWGFMKGGKLHSYATFPMMAQASFNLYRQQDRYADNELAFSVSGSIGRYLGQIKTVDPIYFDVGIGIRGSF